VDRNVSLDVTKSLKQFIEAELVNGYGPVDLKEDDDLLLSGLIDSMGVVRLINFLEEEIKIHVPPEDVTIEHFLTIQAIAGYVESRLQA
jgi:acyl carrier protein